ncbi:MAG: hypothetical protein MI750_03845 [Xanthomonadales bacterium]|jgi:hypothetical protein|nr:hypothetical protein [Xanthomonadales bacterium]
METFSEIREHVCQHYNVVHDEPFVLAIELKFEDGRHQSVFMAELEDRNGRRYLRIESPIAPLGNLEAEKCLRINLHLRIGYLAVGDMDGTPYIKLCENIDYRTLDTTELDFIVNRMGPLADQMEQKLVHGQDIS